MAKQAKRADVVEVALPAAFSDRKNVVGVPQTLAGAAANSPLQQEGSPLNSSCAPDLACCGKRIDTAQSTDAMIAKQYLFAKIRRL
jgi:hypothetical protein